MAYRELTDTAQTDVSAVRRILIYDQNAATHQSYLRTLQDVSVCTGTRYEIAVINSLAALLQSGNQSVDFAIAAMRKDSQLRQVLPRLHRLVDLRCMLLLVDKQTVSAPYATGLHSLESIVAELPLEDTALFSALLRLMDLRSPRQRQFAATAPVVSMIQ